MSSGTVEVSPSIFDRMLGFSHTPGLPREPPRPPLKNDTTHRFYLCQKEEGAKWTYTCQKGTLEEVAGEQVRRQRALPHHPIRTGVHLLSVAAGCPAWNDELVLANKLQRLVKMGEPLATKAAAEAS